MRLQTVRLQQDRIRLQPPSSDFPKMHDEDVDDVVAAAKRVLAS